MIHDCSAQRVCRSRDISTDLSEICCVSSVPWESSMSQNRESAAQKMYADAIPPLFSIHGKRKSEYFFTASKLTAFFPTRSSDGLAVCVWCVCRTHSHTQPHTQAQPHTQTQPRTRSVGKAAYFIMYHSMRHHTKTNSIRQARQKTVL